MKKITPAGEIFFADWFACVVAARAIFEICVELIAISAAKLLRNEHNRSLCALTVSGFAMAVPAQGASINILWYTYGAPTSLYRSQVLDLANRAASLPESAKVQWHVDFFAPGDLAPLFGNYNVLVIQNAEGFSTRPTPTDPDLAPDYSGILNNKVVIEAARGDRTFMSGSDADFHAIRGDSGNCVPVNGCFLYDGAVGYVVNAINWAASGNGMGIVSFYHGELAGGFWWDHPNSFWRAELVGRFSAARDNRSPTLVDLPLNRGLTPRGLSNWTNAFHGRFSDVPGYSGVQFVASDPTLALSIATTAFLTAPAGPAPLLQFELANYQGTESGGAVTLRVTREDNALGAVSVDYATRNGSAVSTADFTTTIGTINFADGVQTAEVIVVPISNDSTTESVESFTVELTNATGGAKFGARSVTTIEIADDDAVVSSGGGGGGGCTISRNGSYDLSLIVCLFLVLGWRIKYIKYAPMIGRSRFQDTGLGTVRGRFPERARGCRAHGALSSAS